jgi:hypothetical protein
LHFAPHALHYLIVVIFAYTGRSWGDEDRKSSVASPMGVRRSTSVKL